MKKRVLPKWNKFSPHAIALEPPKWNYQITSIQTVYNFELNFCVIVSGMGGARCMALVLHTAHSTLTLECMMTQMAHKYHFHDIRNYKYI